MRISLVQLLLLVIIFIIFFHSNFRIIKDFHILLNKIFKKGKKTKSSKNKLDN